MLRPMNALVNSSAMETSHKGVGWYVARLFTAVVGACGFGFQLGQVANDLHAGAQARWVEHIALGVIFLMMAAVNSHLLLSKIREGQES